MKKNETPLLHVGRAGDLSGRDRTLYRLFEMLPAAFSFGTLGVLVFLSFVAPSLVAYFTIGFAAYWLFKTAFLSIHLRHNFIRLKNHTQMDWCTRLESVKVGDIYHIVIFPYYREPYEVLVESIRAIAKTHFPKKQIAIVLAAEERVGEEARTVARRIHDEFRDTFLDIITTIHPQNLPGEIPGKGSNIAWAAKEATARIADARGLAYGKTLVSAFDSDTQVYPQYFECLTWYFATAERPHRSSFQPVPLYNNNIWSAPMLSRILGYSSTFWQMIQQERPERLATFSSHAIPLSALVEVGYWQKNMVNEDSRIFFNLFMHYDGDYRVIPMSYPVSMDANVGASWLQTVVHLYRQHLRWMYGSAENIPYLLYHFMKNPRIPFIKKARLLIVHIEGAWSLAVQPIVLLVVGWLPLLVGGAGFNQTVLSYNLPLVSSWFLTAAMFGLVLLAMYSVRLMPKRPQNESVFKTGLLLAQWLLVPITMVIFSAIPGLDGQLRLALGRYLGFWVTPKQRTTLGG